MKMARNLFAVLFLSDWVNFSLCLVLQYHFVNQPLSWAEAQTYCRQAYTDLVTIGSSEETKELLNTLSSVPHDSEVWVGLFSEIDWRWSDDFVGTGSDYRSWKTTYNEPNFASASQFCVCTDTDGYWWDDFCGNHYPFICNNATGTKLDPEYVYVDQNMSWFDAQTFCRENYIDLATLRNATENQMVATLVPADVYPWIGLFRSPNFYWSDGSDVYSIEFQYVYNPIGSMEVTCGVTSTGSSGRLKFLSCETKLPFVCYSIHSEMKRQVVKLRLKMEDSVDLNDPVLKANVLTTLQNKLAEHGVTGVNLEWSKQPDGEVFQKAKENTED